MMIYELRSNSIVEVSSARRGVPSMKKHLQLHQKAGTLKLNMFSKSVLPASLLYVALASVAPALQTSSHPGGLGPLTAQPSARMRPPFNYSKAFFTLI
eukprot:6201437-Pleurochrysis_carterae.AAC.3